MEILGIDYIFSTCKNGTDFFRDFEEKLVTVWQHFYKDSDSIWEMDNAYYARNRKMSEKFNVDSKMCPVGLNGV